jgi:hypothetical protein
MYSQETVIRWSLEEIRSRVLAWRVKHMQDTPCRRWEILVDGDRTVICKEEVGPSFVVLSKHETGHLSLGTYQSDSSAREGVNHTNTLSSMPRWSSEACCFDQFCGTKTP